MQGNQIQEEKEGNDYGLSIFCRPLFNVKSFRCISMKLARNELAKN